MDRIRHNFGIQGVCIFEQGRGLSLECFYSSGQNVRETLISLLFSKNIKYSRPSLLKRQLLLLPDVASRLKVVRLFSQAEKLDVLKRNSRLVFYSGAPVLFLPSWRAKLASTPGAQPDGETTSGDKGAKVKLPRRGVCVCVGGGGGGGEDGGGSAVGETQGAEVVARFIMWNTMYRLT